MACSLRLAQPLVLVGGGGDGGGGGGGGKNLHKSTVHYYLMATLVLFLVLERACMGLLDPPNRSSCCP